MLKFRCGKQQAPLLQILEDHGVRLLYEYAFPTGISGHVALFVHQLHEGQIIFPAHLGIVLTKGGGDMNDTGTVFHGYIGIADHIVALLVLFFSNLCRSGVKGLVFLMLQLASLIGLQDLRVLSQELLHQGLCQVIGLSVLMALCLDIQLIRMYAEGHV